MAARAPICRVMPSIWSLNHHPAPNWILPLALASWKLPIMEAMVSFCAGFSQLRQDDATADDIPSRADEAQYLAKGTGPGLTRSEKEHVAPAPAPPAT